MQIDLDMRYGDMDSVTIRLCVPIKKKKHLQM